MTHTHTYTHIYINIQYHIQILDINTWKRPQVACIACIACTYSILYWAGKSPSQALLRRGGRHQAPGDTGVRWLRLLVLEKCEEIH